uniref:Apt1 domain-containing protein n=1 Tax=Caenorhabditis japonica TaxID=281687 RepID=A0A8R1HVZ1_CAEJA
MVVDIVNNLALFVDPYKKEMGDKRRRLRFECQLMTMPELRAKIMRCQSELREIVSLGRYLEKQLFYLNQGKHQLLDESIEVQLTQEADETKQRILIVSERLATYISSYNQRQVNKEEEYEDCIAKKGVEVVRRFEVCFEDCSWKLTESDGQISLAQTQIRNFLYIRTVRDSNCGDHLFEVGSIRIANLLPDSIYKHALHRDESRHSRPPAIRLFVRDMPPVGGISVKEHFELNIAPMVAEITQKLFDKMMRFFFPGRNIHAKDTIESEEDYSVIKLFN